MLELQQLLRAGGCSNTAVGVGTVCTTSSMWAVSVVQITPIKWRQTDWPKYRAQTNTRQSGAAYEPSDTWHSQHRVKSAENYLNVRYAGDDGVPDLVLADDVGSSAARFGKLWILIRCYCVDPVSIEEVQRHKVAAAAQETAMRS